MRAELTIKNYRCFPDSRPVRLVVRDGFTAFLGANNSGKSSLLKFFYELRGLFSTLSSPGGNIINPLNGQSNAFSQPSSVGEMGELFYNGNDRPIEVSMKLLDIDGQQHDPPIPGLLSVTIPRDSNMFTLKTSLPGGAAYQGKGSTFHEAVLIVGARPVANFEPYFQLCRQLASTLYIGPFRNAINVGTKESYFDIDIGQAFIKAWRNWKTGPSWKQNEAAFQLTQDIRRIFDFNQLEINASSDDQTLKYLVNGRSFSLSALGSGLAQFVLVLANAATKRPAFILIDEPELNLHPSLQLDFLTTLGSHASRGVLFATHSYGLARARAQSVYTLRYDPDAGSEVSMLESTPRLSELLGELGYSAYRELGFDKILLVEGVTEVLAVQQFLRMYGKDHKIVLLPLGGSSLINGSREQELNEIKRITPHIHSLIDSERTASGAPLAKSREEFVTVCNNLNIPCHVLERRATENYLTEAAVKSVMGNKYQALAPYESLKTLTPTWDKGDNWRIARAMKKDDLDGTDLGEFLASL